MKTLKQIIAIFIFCLCAGLTTATAQTTEFTYQGKLTDNSMSPTANYDFEFRLFSTDTGGTAIGTLQRLGTTVSNGIFTVKLDFGSQFTGAARFIEIGIRPAGSTGGFQQLLPRQSLTSAPYAVRSLNAANADLATTATTATTANNSLQLGGTAANQFVKTTDYRLSDAREPLVGSTLYIQNRATTTQTSTGFNIDGIGKADIFNAVTQYNLGGNRILSIDGTNNFFAGINAGQANTTGTANSFFGRGAGFANTTGSLNSFFGYQAGNSVTTGANSSFFGTQAGFKTTGDGNSFFGSQAGISSTTANYNAFFGAISGNNTTTGDSNTFIGQSSGFRNTTGSRNVFVGEATGDTNTVGSNNTIIGTGADVGNNNLSYATAIGAGSVAAASNSIWLGRINGSDSVFIPGDTSLLGTFSFTPSSGGDIPLCSFGRVTYVIAFCSSSLRYKNNVQTFNGGLDVVRRLRPITFNWIDGGKSDIGFAAEEVNAVEPLLTTFNKDGQIEGVKYGQITTALVNAVKEQQTQIETQNKQIDEQRKQLESQQTQIEALKKFVCQTDPQNAICKEQQ